MNTLKQKRKLAILEDRLQNEEETYETLIEHIKNSSVTNDESIGEIKERLAELHEQIATKEYEIQALLLQPQSAERDRQLKDYRADFRLNTVEFDKLKKIITKKLKIPVNDPAKNVEDVYQEIQNSKKIHLMNSTDIDFEYLGKLKRMIDTMKEFRTIASQTTSGEDKIRHMKIFEDKICEYKREMMLVKMQLRGDRLTLIGGDQRIENISSYLNTAERNLDETIDAIRETRRKIMNDEYLQDSEEIFALRKFLPITIFEKLHDELGEFLERPQRSKTYDLGATTLAAYAVDLANKPETDLREREQLQRSINRANRGLTRQETEISNIRKKIASIVKEREDLQFKIRTHKRLTARNMVDLSEELKTMREKIMVRDSAYTTLFTQHI